MAAGCGGIEHAPVADENVPRLERGGGSEIHPPARIRDRQRAGPRLLPGEDERAGRSLGQAEISTGLRDVPSERQDGGGVVHHHRRGGRERDVAVHRRAHPAAEFVDAASREQDLAGELPGIAKEPECRAGVHGDRAGALHAGTGLGGKRADGDIDIAIGDRAAHDAELIRPDFGKAEPREVQQRRVVANVETPAASNGRVRRQHHGAQRVVASGAVVDERRSPDGRVSKARDAHDLEVARVLRVDIQDAARLHDGLIPHAARAERSG